MIFTTQERLDKPKMVLGYTISMLRKCRRCFMDGTDVIPDFMHGTDAYNVFEPATQHIPKEVDVLW